MEDKITKKNEPEHFAICKRLYALYAAKNHDYDGAFHQTFAKFGRVALAIRLQDKCSRLTALTCKDKQLVKDESVIDTLMDIANYAIMGIMELEKEDGDETK